MATEETYTHGHHESVLRSHAWRTAENSAAYLLAHLGPGLRVLDVGCGPGTITAGLARLVSPGPVVGVDAAAEAVARAREGTGPAANLRYTVGDAYRLGHPDDAFDVVHAHQVLQHLADPVAALREMRRVCKPGGLVAARDADYASFAWAPPDPRLDEWLALYRAVARANGGEPDAGRRLLGWAHAAGLRRVRAFASVWCFATPRDRAWWGGMWADRIRDSAIAGRARELGLADSAALNRIAGAFRDWSAHPDGWFAVPHGEILATK